MDTLNISLHHVSFSYSQKVKEEQLVFKVLNNINTDFPYSSRVAIVGQSGCGKSTLVKLLARY